MSRPGARVAMVIASLAAVVWLVVALVVITDRGDGGTAETLPPVTTTPSTSGSTPPASSSTMPAAVTASPAASAVSTTAATTTTVPAPLVIDFAVPAPAMKPSVLATFPIVDPSSSRPSYLVTTDRHKRIVVIDMISADVSFAELATGTWTTYPSDIPVTNWSGYFVLGPDDVIYAQLLDTGGGVAYALHDGRYVEIGRYPSSVGDQDVVAARTGPAVIGGPARPLTPYLGPDGAPSGATLADNDIGLSTISPTQIALARGARAWNVQLMHNPCDTILCYTVGPGPGDDALISSSLGTSPTHRVTWLSDILRSWDTDWSVAGPVDSGLIVSRTNADQLEIGVAK